MSLFDFRLPELAEYRGDLPEPEDFDAFWSATINAARELPLQPSLRKVETPWRLIDTYDLTFAGFGGAPISAWLSVPAGANAALPTVVQFQGHTNGRAFPHSDLVWAAAGYAHIRMDNRGQGSGTGGPDAWTPDPDIAAGLPHAPGYLTMGITDPQTFYYRRLYTDAARILEAAASLPLVDSSRIIATGASQGGGLALAAAALASYVDVDLLAVAPDVPYLCDFPRSVSLADSRPYDEVTKYLAAWRGQEARVYRTLSYFDAALLGQRASAPAQFSVGLMDRTCPPSSVYAAFNRYAAHSAIPVEKAIEVYSHNGHEGGGDYQTIAQAEFFARLIQASPTGAGR